MKRVAYIASECVPFIKTGGLAVRYFIVGLIVILIRGLLTERIYAFITRDKA